MKKLVGYSFAIVAVVGCSKQASVDNLTAQVEPENQSSVSNIPNSLREPKTTAEDGKLQASPTNAPVSMPPNTTQAVAPGRPARPPMDNLAAKPPQGGEKVASNFKVEMVERAVEVEGVCKLTEDEALCWTPTGEKNEALATELSKAMQNQRDSYSGQYQVKFMKKNRVLVLKTTIQPVNNGGPRYLGGYGLVTFPTNSEFQEGWNTNNTIFNNTNSSGFDNVRTERQVLSGAFEKKTQTFPLRYQFTESVPTATLIELKKGPFTVDGNTYNITSISDKPTNNAQPYYPPGPNGQPGKPPKATYFTIEVVSIKNPYSIASLGAANAKGETYTGLNSKGEPLTAVEFQKYQQEEQRRMMEQTKNGQSYRNVNTWMYGYIGMIGLDPSQSPQTTKSGQINIELSKIKKLVVGISRRTVFVFDKIKLDPN